MNRHQINKKKNFYSFNSKNITKIYNNNLKRRHLKLNISKKTLKSPSFRN